MAIGERVKRSALELLGDPRVVRLLQRREVTNALISLVKGVGRVQATASGVARATARTLGTAPATELADLERRVARLEEEARRVARRLADDEKA